MSAALVFSDVHLGWTLCSRHHEQWLARLPEAVDGAELVVLNGDIVDRLRRVHRAAESELVRRLAELVGGWRGEGRSVVYVEGNHDREVGAVEPLRPDRWFHDFETRGGERVRVLHGHRFSSSRCRSGAYERAGRPLLALENRAYGRIAALRSLYRYGPGWMTAAVGVIECSIWRRYLPRRLAPLLDGVDVLLHGHFHSGPARARIGSVATWRTGAFVSPGHLGSADRMLRYRDGRFERIGWSGGRWRATDDGR